MSDRFAVAKVQRMARKRKRRRKPVDALQIFGNAHRFVRAASALNDIQDRAVLLLPTIVLEAFSLELFLKCLHRIRKRYVPVHDIQHLFTRLSATDKRIIREHFRIWMTKHHQYQEAIDKNIPLDLDSVLIRCKDIFHGARYAHEELLPKLDATGFPPSNAGAGTLIEAINARILEIHPDWRSITLHGGNFG